MMLLRPFLDACLTRHGKRRWQVDLADLLQDEMSLC